MTASTSVRCGGKRDSYFGTYKGRMRVTTEAFGSLGGLGSTVSFGGGSSVPQSKGKTKVREFDVTLRFYRNDKNEYCTEQTVTPRSGGPSYTEAGGYSIDLHGNGPGKVSINLALSSSVTIGHKPLNPADVGVEKARASQVSGSTSQGIYAIKLTADSCGTDGVPGTLRYSKKGLRANIEMELTRQ